MHHGGPIQRPACWRQQLEAVLEPLRPLLKARGPEEAAVPAANRAVGATTGAVVTNGAVPPAAGRSSDSSSSSSDSSSSSSSPAAAGRGRAVKRGMPGRSGKEGRTPPPVLPVRFYRIRGNSSCGPNEANCQECLPAFLVPIHIVQGRAGLGVAGRGGPTAGPADVATGSGSAAAGRRCCFRQRDEAVNQHAWATSVPCTCDRCLCFRDLNAAGRCKWLRWLRCLLRTPESASSDSGCANVGGERVGRWQPSGRRSRR